MEGCGDAAASMRRQQERRRAGRGSLDLQQSVELIGMELAEDWSVKRFHYMAGEHIHRL